MNNPQGVSPSKGNQGTNEDDDKPEDGLVSLQLPACKLCHTPYIPVTSADPLSYYNSLYFLFSLSVSFF